MDNALITSILRNLFLLKLREVGGETTGRLNQVQRQLACLRWNHFNFSIDDFYLTIIDCYELGIIELNFSNRVAKIKLTKSGREQAEMVYSRYYIEDKGLVE